MSAAPTADVNAASNTSTSTYAELFVSGQVTICVPPYFERTRRSQRMPKKEATAIKTIAVTMNKSAVVSMFLTSFSGKLESCAAGSKLHVHACRGIAA